MKRLPLHSSYPALIALLPEGLTFIPNQLYPLTSHPSAIAHRRNMLQRNGPHRLSLNSCPKHPSPPFNSLLPSRHHWLRHDVEVPMDPSRRSTYYRLFDPGIFRRGRKFDCGRCYGQCCRREQEELYGSYHLCRILRWQRKFSLPASCRSSAKCRSLSRLFRSWGRS